MASLPYPRRPLNNSPTDGTDAHRWLGCIGFSHGIHGIHRSFWRKYSPTDFTDAHRLGGYGIPAIPTQPSANPPTEFTEFTEVSGARYSPTDFTDAHRLGGYGIPAIPTPPSANPPTEFTEFTEASGGEEPPTDAHRCTQMVRLRRALSQNSQKFLA